MDGVESLSKCDLWHKGAIIGAYEALQARLEAGEVIIMDGGTGSELQRRGVPMGTASWSATSLLTHPDTVRAVHEDFTRAGAKIIITNTFSTGRTCLEKDGLGAQTLDMNRLAVRLALEARKNVPSKRPVVVAGSMSTFPPKSDATVTPSYETALADYREQARLLADAGVDLILAEMIIRTLDARAAVQAASEVGLPVWVGYSCGKRNRRLLLGILGKLGKESISDAVDAVVSSRVSALFIMHTAPQSTGLGLEELRARTAMTIGAYAHTTVGAAGGIGTSTS